VINVQQLINTILLAPQHGIPRFIAHNKASIEQSKPE
jgi:hypothetical protein